MKPKFSDILEDNPDYYGPMWIYITIIIGIVISSNINAYLNTPV